MQQLGFRQQQKCMCHFERNIIEQTVIYQFMIRANPLHENNNQRNLLSNINELDYTRLQTSKNQNVIFYNSTIGHLQSRADHDRAGPVHQRECTVHQRAESTD